MTFYGGESYELLEIFLPLLYLGRIFYYDNAKAKTIPQDELRQETSEAPLFVGRHLLRAETESLL